LALARRIFREGDAPLAGELRRLLADYDVFAACRTAVRGELDRARHALELLQVCEGSRRLVACADFLAAQMDSLRVGGQPHSTHG
jgi:hypothetical protein